jgi:hypothetical protein
MANLTLGPVAVGNNPASAIDNLVTNDVNNVNNAIAQINVATLGPSDISVGPFINATLSQPVGPSVTVDVPAYTGSILAVLDPPTFQGTVNFYTGPAGATPGGPPSFVGLAGVGADSGLSPATH